MPYRLKPGPWASHSTRALQARGIGRHFGDTAVLDDLDLEIPAGQAVVIIGRSGCGKTTLLRLLAGLDIPDAGELQLGGRPLAGSDARIRLMFQEARLLPWKSVGRNVALGVNDRELAAQALAEVELGDMAARWPSALSGGQRQRVALARALVHRPDLLLLDEPLGALDALTRTTMHRLLERLWQRHGFTLAMVTHDVGEAVTLADRVILLDNGAIAMDLAIDLPRPRRRTDAAFVAYEARILARLTGDCPTGAAVERQRPEAEPRWPSQVGNRG